MERFDNSPEQSQEGRSKPPEEAKASVLHQAEPSESEEELDEIALAKRNFQQQQSQQLEAPEEFKGHKEELTTSVAQRLSTASMLQPQNRNTPPEDREKKFRELYRQQRNSMIKTPRNTRPPELGFSMKSRDHQDLNASMRADGPAREQVSHSFVDTDYEQKAFEKVGSQREALRDTNPAPGGMRARDQQDFRASMREGRPAYEQVSGSVVEMDKVYQTVPSQRDTVRERYPAPSSMRQEQRPRPNQRSQQAFHAPPHGPPSAPAQAPASREPVQEQRPLPLSQMNQGFPPSNQPFQRAPELTIHNRQPNFSNSDIGMVNHQQQFEDTRVQRYQTVRHPLDQQQPPNQYLPPQQARPHLQQQQQFPYQAEAMNRVHDAQINDPVYQLGQLQQSLQRMNGSQRSSKDKPFGSDGYVRENGGDQPKWKCCSFFCKTLLIIIVVASTALNILTFLTVQDLDQRIVKAPWKNDISSYSKVLEAHNNEINKLKKELAAMKKTATEDEDEDNDEDDDKKKDDLKWVNKTMDEAEEDIDALSAAEKKQSNKISDLEEDLSMMKTEVNDLDDFRDELTYICASDRQMCHCPVGGEIVFRLYQSPVRKIIRRVPVKEKKDEQQLCIRTKFVTKTTPAEGFLYSYNGFQAQCLCAVNKQ